MAFGVDYTGFLDSFDAGKVVGTNAQKDARERANAFLGTAMVGGAGVDTIGTTKYKEILGDAQGVANKSAQGADLFGKVAGFAEGLGSFGAAGGFNTLGKTIGVDRASAGMGISGSVAPKTGLEYFGPAF